MCCVKRQRTRTRRFTGSTTYVATDDLLGPIFSVGANFSMPVTSLQRGHPLTVEMAARLKATGVAINNMDGFVLVPDMNIDEMQPMLELTAELGARNVVTLGFDPETDRLGEGPLSEVYRAVDLQLGRTVALKILRAHAEIDPREVVASAPLVVDFRGVTHGIEAPNLVRL